MKHILMALIAIITAAPGYSQHSYHAIIKDTKTKEPLIGATAQLVGTTLGGSADANGLVTIQQIPAGRYAIIYRFIGFETRSDTLEFPLATADTALVLLEAEEGEDLDEVVISTTRSSRTIADMPTRVEFIAGEELEEKSNMKPGDIRMLLSESTGIQTQQTSATSANASIRIQGLDGRYTQILKDGFPLYSGAASGLGLLQTPPLDLKQVEVIKGSSSTLYGGGAIAGLVNLISKTPTEERELRFHINGTSAKGIDVNGFYGQRFGKVGTTIFAAYNGSAAYDPAGIGLSAIPKVGRYTVNPRLFWYLSKRTTATIGVNTTLENRVGGSMPYIKGETDSANTYFERNETKRFSTQLTLQHKLNEQSQLTLKNSYSYFDRTITIPGYQFNGVQQSTFTEVNYTTASERLEWVAGANVWTDAFAEKLPTNVPLRDYSQNTLGVFVQNTFQATPKFFVETGIRGDYVIDYGFAFLPRVSLLYKATPKLSTRLGGGLGYKPPTIFTEESERIQYRDVLGVHPDSNRLETSYGANWDINYRTSFADGDITFSINHLFYYTRLNNPLMLVPRAAGLYSFDNIAGHMDSKGTETNIKLGYRDFKLFLGYTFTDAYIHQAGIKTENPLTPKHRVNSVLMYEVEDKWKIGLEGYYIARQKLSDGTTGRDYWIMGFMAERLWERFSVYINFENFLDARQTRFDTIYTGTLNNPQFRDIYAPLDGFVINGGIKLRL
ncbi:MAG: collagen-binding protein [Bacteroidetes bacterium 46-16]|nr:MAG: collagen-binding protein [Bacteroidetes bacterium 46-16]